MWWNNLKKGNRNRYIFGFYFRAHMFCSSYNLTLPNLTKPNNLTPGECLDNFGCNDVLNQMDIVTILHDIYCTSMYLKVVASRDELSPGKQHLWHDQGKWVTRRIFQLLFSYTTFSKLQEASFWCKPHYNWISGYGVMKDFTMLKTI